MNTTEILIEEIKKLNGTLEVLQKDIAKLADENSHLRRDFVSLREFIAKDRLLNGFVGVPDKVKDLTLLTSFLEKESDIICSTRAVNHLVRAGIFTVEDLSMVDMYTIRHIRNIGDCSVEDIVNFSKQLGLEIPARRDEDLILPDIKVGDFVLTQIRAKEIPENTVVMVKEVYPIDKRQGTVYRALPIYLCTWIDHTVIPQPFSASQIMKV